MPAINRRALRALAVSASTLAVVYTAPAMAQVEEIVVTAQKVEENVQDVPIAINAYSGEFLEAQGIVDYGDRAEHCWNGDHENGNHLSRLRYNTMYLPRILELIRENAPMGAALDFLGK